MGRALTSQENLPFGAQRWALEWFRIHTFERQTVAAQTTIIDDLLTSA